MLVGANLLRRLLRSQLSADDGGTGFIITAIYHLRPHYSTTTEFSDEGNSEKKKESKWFTLPPFAKTVNASELGAKLARKNHLKSATSAETSAYETTALKWVLKCCPELPRNLVQKLFRLRQVRRESIAMEVTDDGCQVQKIQLKRVGAKDSLNIGDKIFLPISVCEVPEEKHEHDCTDEESNFIRSLELYKDTAIIVLNKPPGMPVQGGIGIKWSLDELAAAWLRYDYSESPRLVHRLDRDCSGILVMGRTQMSAAILHSVFREETLGASKHDSDNEKRVLQKRYWALVIGSPRRPKGTISAPLRKVVVDDGKSDRITVFEHNNTILSSQRAITEYRVIKTSTHGFTWLELSPVTGRKHQLRVHCAEVLGTPIVGDYKYGWHAHRRLQNLAESDLRKNSNEKVAKENMLPFGLNMDSGSISEKHLRLHLHCREMILPNVSQVLRNQKSLTDDDLSKLKSLEIVAPLPSYMQKSWDILNA
ncbi:hypothetical protein E1A91_D01G009600v1 [Gossypium mustelinum]|uniref:Pseudouridine synthase RsuA/RluA-like domain-containing protein n=1 Tax=Gossypium mustelinum TaxID=34275 RepID=A0A5D2W1W9_GOSMU|nr:hypothetical protein E1A91_D01G009600v1 [Gossypium mustelinum]